MFTAPTRTCRAWSRALIRVFVVAVGLLLFAGPRLAAADNVLESSTPPDGATLPESPVTFQLIFRDELGVANTAKLACDGANIAVSTPQVGEDLRSISFQISTNLAPGSSCSLAYRVSNTDGQLGLDSTLNFKIAGSVPTTTTTTAPGAVTTGTVAPVATNAAKTSSGSGLNGLLALSRLLANFGFAALFGALVLIIMVWPEGTEYDITVNYLRIVALVGLIGSFLTLVILAGRADGGGLTDGLSPGAWFGVTDVTGGTAALLRFFLAIGCMWVVIRPDRINDPSQQTPSVAIPGIAVLTLAFTRGTDPGLIGVVAGMVHVVAMALWLGGLLLLAGVVLSGPGEEDLVHAVRGFKRLSPVMILVTVVSGLVLAYKLDWSDLVGTGHGKVVILKVLAVGGMIFVGLASRELVKKRLSRVDAMTSALAARLRRAVSMEALAGVIVLALTAWLTSLAPPGLTKTVAATTDALGPAHRLTNIKEDVAATIRLTEAVGPNAVFIDIDRPPAGLVDVELKFTPPPGSDGHAVLLKVPLPGAGQALLPKSANMPLDVPGVWTIILTINNQLIGSTNVNIQASSDIGTVIGNEDTVITDDTSITEDTSDVATEDATLPTDTSGDTNPPQPADTTG